MRSEIVKWIRIVVFRTVKGKGLINLDIDNLISAGYLGYAQALKNYDERKKVKFKTFAEYRIKGAVLDEVRRVIGDERCKTERPVRVNDVDFEMIIDPRDYGCEFEIDFEKFMDALPMTVREKNILRSRIQGMSLKEIGQQFRFSESRASQILYSIRVKAAPTFERFFGIKVVVAPRFRKYRRTSSDNGVRRFPWNLAFADMCRRNRVGRIISIRSHQFPIQPLPWLRASGQ